MSQTKGYAAPIAKAPLAPFSFERREPGEHDVVIDIKYCGICHSDIHQTRNEWGDFLQESIFPMVPGHEILVVVPAIAGKVNKHKIGGKVDASSFEGHWFYATTDPDSFTELAVYFGLSCKTCSGESEWNQYLCLGKVDRTVVLVGVPEKKVPVGAIPLLARRRSLAGSAIGG